MLLFTASTIKELDPVIIFRIGSGETVYGAVPPVIVNVAVIWAALHEVEFSQIEVEVGFTASVAIGTAVTLSVAVAVCPAASLTVYVAVVAAVAGGTVTVNVPPLAVTVAGAGGKPRVSVVIV
jgi:hypothetical protein